MGELETINEEADIKLAAKVMSERKIRHLPVVNGEGEIVGMVTVTDLSMEIKDL